MIEERHGDDRGAPRRRSRGATATIEERHGDDRGAPRRRSRSATATIEERHGDDRGAPRRRSRGATAPPGRPERWGVWGAISEPPISIGGPYRGPHVTR